MDPVVLNAEICNASSRGSGKQALQNVLNIVEARLDEMNLVNMSTALHRLAKLQKGTPGGGGPGGSPHPSFLQRFNAFLGLRQRLLQAMEEILHGHQPRGKDKASPQGSGDVSVSSMRAVSSLASLRDCHITTSCHVLGVRVFATSHGVALLS